MASQIANNGHGHRADPARSAIDELHRLAEAERDRAKHADTDDMRDDSLIAAERYASRAWSIDEGYIRDF